MNKSELFLVVVSLLSIGGAAGIVGYVHGVREGELNRGDLMHQLEESV